MPPPVAIAPTYLSGYDGKVIVDAESVPITGWNGDDKVGTWDATCSEDGGNAHPERTIRSMNGSFEANYRAVGDPPDIESGSIYPLQLITKAGKGYSFNALLTGVNTKLDVKGGVTYTGSYESQGPILKTLPGP